ncbi:L-threonylcarbamoyladenylate synthase [Blattabacterium cuenoti]|uniref:L-threonylcarbamoyladenylate synthase n=1 Tax=Blattabacterium cuenoti TaxID=1653831 RepID=UPI00163D0930|nr:L-threonylcarbamoyladenylate synthase [Blattabacterium cuenoti]
MCFQDEVDQSVKFLKNGKNILYPTDTVWGIGCDAFDINAVKKIYRIKNRSFSKPMIILVDKIDRLYELLGKKISIFTQQLILYNDQINQKPITIIYQVKKRIFDKFFYKGNTLAIRLTHDPFCKCLIQKLNRPIISTSANISGFNTPKSFSEIAPYILSNIDYAVKLKRKEKAHHKNSQIIQILSNRIKIFRT